MYLETVVTILAIGLVSLGIELAQSLRKIVNLLEREVEDDVPVYHTEAGSSLSGEPISPLPRTVKHVEILDANGNVTCTRPEGHHDLKTFLDTPGYALRHSNGAVEEGTQ